MNVLKLLAEDKNLITYRKELNQITGGVMATILLQQLIYWTDKNNNKPFYKFIEPCNNEKYIKGDSWTEELGFTKKEFIGAYKKLEDLNLVSKKINMMRVTFYTLNIEVLSKLLNGIYVSDKRELTKVTKGDLDYSKSFDTETTTETTTDINKKNKQKKSSLSSQISTKLQEAENTINVNAFGEWMDYKKYKSIAPISKTINFLSQFDFDTQQQIVDTSIMNGYKGLFEPKQQKQPNQNISFQEQERQRTAQIGDAVMGGFDPFDPNNYEPQNNEQGVIDVTIQS